MFGSENIKVRNLYLGAIVLLFVGLVFSKFLISISQFVLVGAWFLDKNYRQKILRIKKSPATLIFISIFFVFLLGMLWTENFAGGMRTLKIKLPILVIPFVVVGFPALSKKEFHFLLFSFIFIVFAKTIHALIVLFANEYLLSVRTLRIKISHIRLALIINLALFSVIYLYKNDFFTKKWQKTIALLSLIWFLFSIFLTKSATGFIVFIVVCLGLSIFYFFKLENKKLRFLLLALIILVPTFSFFYIKMQVADFYEFKDLPYADLPTHTANNNLYTHDSTDYFVENGYKVGYYVCEEELRAEWNKVSNFKYDSVDVYGYKIQATLKRYLTSLGYPKDSVGVSLLSAEDIKNIEKSISNYKLRNGICINSRIYKIIWQLYIYKNSNDPNNQSVTQRIEFLKTAFRIIKDNLWLGVGTGDLKEQFRLQYEKDKTKLQPKNRYLSHNQYVTFVATFGIILGTWCILALFLPFFINKKYKNFMASVFFIIVMLSMLNEDTLATSIGISFFAIFYSLLILQHFDNNKYNKKI